MTTELTTTKAGGALAEVTTGWLEGLPNPNTKTAYTAALSDFAAWLGKHIVGEPWTVADLPVNLGGQFGAREVKGYLDDLLADGKSRSTANHRLYVLRRWTRELVNRELMHPAKAAAILAIPGYRTVNRIYRTHLDDDDIQRLLDAIPSGTEARLIDKRDVAIIGVLAWTGLRRSELVALDVEDFQKSNGHALLNNIERKGGSLTDFVKLQPALATAVRRWLDAAGITEGALFQSVDKADNLKGRRLTGEAVRLMLRVRCERAGLPLISPHALRRSWCTNALAAGADLEAVRVGGGWANFSMVSRYNQGRQILEDNATDVLDYNL